MEEEIKFLQRLRQLCLSFKDFMAFAKKLRKQNVHHQDVSSILADDGGFWCPRSECNQKRERSTAVNVAFRIRSQQSKQLKTLTCEFIALNKCNLILKRRACVELM